MTIEYDFGPTVMLTLGDFQFGVLTAAYQELQRTTEYRWPAQDRFMQDQALQFIGPGGDTITLPGVIYPEYRGGIGQLNDMRDIAGDGEPLILIDGLGKILGKWSIERIEEKQTVFAAEGVPRKQEFTLNLRRFGDLSPEEEAQVAAEAAAAGLAAVEDAIEAGQDAAGVIDSAIGLASSLAGGITDAINQVQDVAEEIGDAVGTIIAPMQRAYSVATGLMNAAGDAKAMLGSSVAAIAQATSLGKLLNAATSAAANSGQAGKLLGRAAADLGTLPANAAAAVVNAQISVNRLTVGATATYTAAQSAIGRILP